MKPVRKRFLSKRAAVGRRYYPNRLLTLREREVLGWLARGKSNAEIGAILGISSATVGLNEQLLDSQSRCPASLDSVLRSEPPAVKLAPCQRLEHIYPKLGVENRTAAASFASEL